MSGILCKGIFIFIFPSSNMPFTLFFHKTRSRKLPKKAACGRSSGWNYTRTHVGGLIEASVEQAKFRVIDAEYTRQRPSESASPRPGADNEREGHRGMFR